MIRKGQPYGSEPGAKVGLVHRFILGCSHHAIEAAEAFHREIHQRFAVGRAPSVCPVKGYVFAEFFFEVFLRPAKAGLHARLS